MSLEKLETSGAVAIDGAPLLDVNNIEVIYDHVILVLKGVSLQVPEGGVVALLGANGAGKSTLLKLLTGVTQPTTGTIQTSGRVASLLELGAGFHPEFSGRDNIFLNCSILGMSEEEIEARFESIVTFSELGDFIDRPVKTYSSGMYVRLGFSVASSVDPDILLIDEALAVGDRSFREKSAQRLDKHRADSGTVLLVSHNLSEIRRSCDRVIWLQDGLIVADGPTDEVLASYEAS